MDIEDYYADKENCLKDLKVAREAMGSKSTTEEQWEQLDKGLSLMLVYCPEELNDIVYAQLLESERRRFYLGMV
jgi:hypothetical protein